MIMPRRCRLPVQHAACFAGWRVLACLSTWPVASAVSVPVPTRSCGDWGPLVIASSTPATDYRVGRGEPSLRYLDHCMAVADIHLRLITAARSSLLQLQEVDLEPDAW